MGCESVATPVAWSPWQSTQRTKVARPIKSPCPCHSRFKVTRTPRTLAGDADGSMAAPVPDAVVTAEINAVLAYADHPTAWRDIGRSRPRSLSAIHRRDLVNWLDEMIRGIGHSMPHNVGVVWPSRRLKRSDDLPALREEYKLTFRAGRADAVMPPGVVRDTGNGWGGDTQFGFWQEAKEWYALLDAQAAANPNPPPPPPEAEGEEDDGEGADGAVEGDEADEGGAVEGEDDDEEEEGAVEGDDDEEEEEAAVEEDEDSGDVPSLAHPPRPKKRASGEAGNDIASQLEKARDLKKWMDSSGRTKAKAVERASDVLAGALAELADVLERAEKDKEKETSYATVSTRKRDKEPGDPSSVSHQRSACLVKELETKVAYPFLHGYTLTINLGDYTENIRRTPCADGSPYTYSEGDAVSCVMDAFDVHTLSRGDMTARLDFYAILDSNAILAEVKVATDNHTLKMALGELMAAKHLVTRLKCYEDLDDFHLVLVVPTELPREWNSLFLENQVHVVVPYGLHEALEGARSELAAAPPAKKQKTAAGGGGSSTDPL